MTEAPDDLDETWPTARGPILRPGSPTLPTIEVVDWAARSEVGAVRRRNEDRWGQRDAQLFLVADGMGGHDGGELAATTAVELALVPGTEPWRQRLESVNETIRVRAHDAGQPGAGTTLVAVALDGTRATIVGVGDSRVYRLREGHVDQLTEDHTLRGQLLAAGIDADLHASGKRGQRLASYLGIRPDRLRIDVIDVPVRSGDRLLLCSDGVHGAMETTQLEDLLASGDAAQAVDGLLATAERAGGRDNATAIVLELGPPRPKERP